MLCWLYHCGAVLTAQVCVPHAQFANIAGSSFVTTWCIAALLSAFTRAKCTDQRLPWLVAQCGVLPDVQLLRVAYCSDSRDRCKFYNVFRALQLCTPAQRCWVTDQLRLWLSPLHSTNSAGSFHLAVSAVYYNVRWLCCTAAVYHCLRLCFAAACACAVVS